MHATDLQNESLKERPEAIFAPTVSFRALDRAIGTLSFFLQIQLPVFRRNLEDTWSLLPILYFSEMTIYHLDEINEDRAAGKGIGTHRLAETLNVLSRILRANGVYDERVKELFSIGLEYWQLELRLCKNLNEGTRVTMCDAERTLRKKSFDLAHMRHLLRIGFGIDECMFAQIDKVLTSFDFWAEVLDDYYDYEKDERNRSFNIVRCFRQLVPESELSEGLILYAKSALSAAADQAQMLPLDTREHLNRHVETFMRPESAVDTIINQPQSTFQSPDADTEVYGIDALSKPAFSFANFLSAFDLMQHVSKCVLPLLGLSFANFTCRKRNKAFFLSSLLVSNWDVLSKSTQSHGIWELQKLNGCNFSNCFVNRSNSYRFPHLTEKGLSETQVSDVLFVLQNLLSLEKCEETKHNEMWCKHSENAMMLDLDIVYRAFLRDNATLT